MKLLEHFRNMQLMAAHYIEPTGAYVSLLNGSGVTGRVEETDSFANDMIYSLDGPQQREAQAEAEAFDSFIPNALRTLSPGFSGSKIPVIVLLNAVTHFRQAADRLDLVKKVLFYDKPQAFAELQSIMPMLGVDPTAPVIACLTHDISDHDKDILHGILGVCTEAGELAEALEKVMNGDVDELDETNVKEETGDILWYFAILYNRIGTDFPAEMARVIAKLRERFPAKFTNDNANVRNLAAERAVLEAPIAPPSNPNTRLVQVPAVALDEARAALRGAIAVIGDAANLGHALHLLDDAAKEPRSNIAELAAIGADRRERERERDTVRKQTSSTVSTIAARYIHFGQTDMFHALGIDPASSYSLNGAAQLVTAIRAMAASCMSQDETKGNSKSLLRDATAPDTDKPAPPPGTKYKPDGFA